MIISHCLVQLQEKAMGFEQKLIHPAWLSNPTVSKFFHLTYMTIIHHNIKILLSHLYGFLIPQCQNLSVLPQKRFLDW